MIHEAPITLSYTEYWLGSESFPRELLGNVGTARQRLLFESHFVMFTMLLERSPSKRSMSFVSLVRSGVHDCAKHTQMIDQHSRRSILETSVLHRLRIHCKERVTRWKIVKRRAGTHGVDEFSYYMVMKIELTPLEITGSCPPFWVMDQILPL